MTIFYRRVFYCVCARTVCAQRPFRRDNMRFSTRLFTALLYLLYLSLSMRYALLWINSEKRIRRSATKVVFRATPLPKSKTFASASSDGSSGVRDSSWYWDGLKLAVRRTKFRIPRNSRQTIYTAHRLIYSETRCVILFGRPGRCGRTSRRIIPDGRTAFQTYFLRKQF